MRGRLSMLILAACLLLSASAIPADDPAATQGPAGEKFAQLFADWNELYAKARDLERRYAEASAAEKSPIRDEYNAISDQLAQMGPAIAEAAKQAYAESPNADPNAAQMVIGMAVGAYGRDSDEEAAELTKLLLDNKCEDPAMDSLFIAKAESACRLDKYEEAAEITTTLLDNECQDAGVYNPAGIAAFCLNEFIAAFEYLDKANRAERISKVGRKYLAICDDYRRFWKKERALRAFETSEDNLPRVKLATTKGDIVLELFENEAPQTVGNFVHLVEKGFYDGVIFHRVLPNFMAQGGCPAGTGIGDPGYKIPCECYRPNHRKHFRGSLSMAKGKNRDTGGSQFFLTFVPTDLLNGRHTVFGRVMDGMDVLAKIRRRDPAKLTEILANSTGLPDYKINPLSQLKSDLKVTPEVAEKIRNDMEQELGVTVTPETWAGLKTVGDLGKLVPADKIIEASVVRKRDHEYVPTKAN